MPALSEPLSTPLEERNSCLLSVWARWPQPSLDSSPEGVWTHRDSASITGKPARPTCGHALSPTVPPSSALVSLLCRPCPETHRSCWGCAAELWTKQGAGLKPILPPTHWASLSSRVTSDPQFPPSGNRDKGVKPQRTSWDGKAHRCSAKHPGGSVYSTWGLCPGVTPSPVHPLLRCGALGKSITLSEALSSRVR